ncbi:clathrin coat assembly protein, putative [Theileria equi strain WA]|uniref:AP complex subunit sigma n=1 Tax=Theileria equi strain WA TaxID=1537102 RepID=L1LEU4_THEEQ|nr:clathrin coat assembly protein, putative [Theileria equi strain WA]EKX73789.1 clathrin coat assembly protein, putative [Theileria equi strain WA]|eukprot:XP_004833241.1 clathrin coat assembly protein, putative [Theileria equi strain WA]
MIKFFLAISRQCKVRLVKWFVPIDSKEKATIIKELSHLVVNRNAKQCNFLEWRKDKIVFRRYASLYFMACVDTDTNELIVLEMIHHYVELLDSYFRNVCELDLVFNFHKAYHLFDEVFIDGDFYESNKRAVLRSVAAQDAMTEKSKPFSSKTES